MQRKPNRSNRLQKKVEKFTTALVKEYATRLADGLIVLSPTGKPYDPFWEPQSLPPDPNYTPGLFASNWQLGLNSEPDGLLGNAGEDAAKDFSMQNIREAISAYTPGDRIFLVNNAPYAHKLEENPPNKSGKPFSLQVPEDGIVGSVMANSENLLELARAAIR